MLADEFQIKGPRLKLPSQLSEVQRPSESTYVNVLPGPCIEALDMEVLPTTHAVLHAPPILSHRPPFLRETSLDLGANCSRHFPSHSEMLVFVM
jgi:hypothetical protein